MKIRDGKGLEKWSLHIPVNIFNVPPVRKGWKSEESRAIIRNGDEEANKRTEKKFRRRQILNINAEAALHAEKFAEPGIDLTFIADSEHSRRSFDW